MKSLGTILLFVITAVITASVISAILVWNVAPAVKVLTLAGFALATVIWVKLSLLVHYLGRVETWSRLTYTAIELARLSPNDRTTAPARDAVERRLEHSSLGRLFRSSSARVVAILIWLVFVVVASNAMISAWPAG